MLTDLIDFQVDDGSTRAIFTSIQSRNHRGIGLYCETISIECRFQFEMNDYIKKYINIFSLYMIEFDS